MIFDFIKNLIFKENREIDFYNPLDLEYFFKPLNRRGKYNYGLIACFNSLDDNTKKFLKKYTDEANSNGVISRDYLDTIPQNKELMKQMDKLMDESEDYSYGSFLYRIVPGYDLEEILSYASRMLNYFSDEYRNFKRPGDFNIYMNECWYIVGQFLHKYYKILQLIPKAKKNRYPLKFLYYGCPTNSAFLFFYILVKNYCDVVVVSPKDYNYKEEVNSCLRIWIKYNRLVDSYEKERFIYYNTIDL